MTTDHTGISAWLRQRAPRWERVESLLNHVARGRQRESDETVELLREYRGVARDLALSRQAFGNGRVTQYLESLFSRAHHFVHRSPERTWPQLVQLIREEVPRDMRALRGPLLASITLFFVTALAGWWLVHAFPELASLFASEEMIQTVRKGKLWTDDLLNVTPSAVLSLGIMTNNIAVTLFAFALGAFYGIGTLYILGLNGLMLGGIFAFTGQYDLAGRLFEFVVAHGVVEISIILIAGAAGIRLGEALARPGHRTRVEAFQEAVGQAGRLVAVGAPFLVGAGIIEGNISPDPQYDLATRIAVGLAYWVFMLLVFSGRIWRVGRGGNFTAKDAKVM